MKRFLSIFIVVGFVLVGGGAPVLGQGGPIFLSGDDADDSGHCQGTACGGLYPDALKTVVTNSTSGGIGIVAIGANSSNALAAFNSWNLAANGGPGAAVTFCNTTGAGGCIRNVNFANFEAIYIASNDNNTGGGLTATQLADLNSRQASIVTFVNTLGGGLMALTEARDAAQYGWLPLALTTQNVDHFGPDIFPTSDMILFSAGITSGDLNHGCCYHTRFSGPAGFSGLKVLAFHDHNGNGQFDGQASGDHVLILGGLQVTIQGNISLSPATDTNFVGASHTVTATALDGSPLAPAVGVTVTFTVSSGPNAGTTGTGTSPTDGAGQASFTYVGSGGVGTDGVVAQFTDQAGALQTSNTVQKIWEPIPNQPPLAVCQNVTVSADSNCESLASVDGGSSDPDGDPITLTQVPPGPYALGDTSVTLTVTDPDGASDSCTATVTVIDDEAPVVTCPPDTGIECDASSDPVLTGAATSTDNCTTIGSAAQSNIGLEFWACDLDHLGGQNFAIAVANPSGSISANVTISKDTGTVATGIVPPGGLQTFLLGTNHINGTATSKLPTFRVVSDIPVVAYQFNSIENVFTNDAALLLPKAVLSTSYFIASWQQTSNSGSPQIGIVAIESGTTNYTVVNGSGGLVESGVLTQFDTRQLSFSNTTNIGGFQVTSDKPVAVFGGHQCTSIGDGCCCDHLEEQMFPESTLGTNFAVCPSNNLPLGGSTTTKDVFRVFSTVDGTVVTTVPNVGGGIINKGQFIEIVENQEFVLTASQPILVAQFLVSQNTTVVNGEFTVAPGTGDPAMILLVPVEQFQTDYIFLTPNTYAFDFVDIITEVGNSLTLDGAPLTDTCTSIGTIGGVSYCCVRKLVSDGAHTLSGTKAFGIQVVGFDQFASYGYAGGGRLRIINDPSAAVSSFTDSEVAGACIGQSVISRTWEATDGGNNTGSCVQVITVDDTTAPSISCPADTTLECPGDTGVLANGSPTGADNCSSPTFSSTDVSAPGCGNTETITRSWVATDDCNNGSAPCDQTVEVVDTTDPTVTCPADQTVECDGLGNTADVNGWFAGASTSDTCGGAVLSDDFLGLSDLCGATGAATVTWTGTDDCTNSASCSGSFTIEDTTSPVLTVDTTPITVSDADCSGDEVVTLPTPTATDTCGGVTISDDAPATFPAGQTTTVTFTATDDCGNSSSASVDVTVLYGADIWVTASKHTVGSGSSPGSTKEPFVGIEICAYDKADGSCARVTCGGISHQHYECIATTCAATNCCTTDADGMCNLNLPPGDYVVISRDATKTTLPDPLGVSASDLICGEHKQKHLQQIIKVKSDGSKKKTPGKTTRRTGSELLIIEPEYVIWDGTVQEYPFVFETVGDWSVTATVAPPEGFVSDHDSLSASVDSTIQVVQFTITEVGSDLVPTRTTFDVTHKGRREIIHSKVDIFLTAQYARSRGFNVRALRAAGLIKELPDQAAFGQSQRASGGE